MTAAHVTDVRVGDAVNTRPDLPGGCWALVTGVRVHDDIGLVGLLLADANGTHLPIENTTGTVQVASPGDVDVAVIDAP